MTTNPEKPSKVKAVGYVRVSSPGQVKEGESLDTQRQQIKDFCKQKGWELVHIYSDEGISGVTVEARTDFKKMTEDAEQGKFDVIVFTKLSRFARNARDYQNIAHDLNKHGVMLASVKENIDPTTNTGRLIAGLFALIAEWEHETIREQMAENKVAKWKDGRTFVGRVPYGYNWNKDKKQLEFNDKQAEVYKLIVKMYLDQGLSYQDIVLTLKAQGIKCGKADWSSATVSYVLKNPCYYGNYVLNKFEYAKRKNKKGRMSAKEQRTKRLKPVSEWITFKIPQLFDKARWDQIQERLEFNKHKSKRSAKRTKPFYLRDVLRCGRCGGKLTHKWGNKREDGTAPRYYACYWRGASEKELKAAGRERCTLRYFEAEELEKSVWSELCFDFGIGTTMKRYKHPVLERLFNPEKYKARMQELQETISRLDAELKKKQRARDDLFKFMGDEKMEKMKDELSKRLLTNNDEIVELEGNLNKAQSEYRALEALQKKEQETRDFVKDNKDEFGQLWRSIEKLHIDDRKVLVEGMVQGNIVVDCKDGDFPDKVTVDFKHKLNIDILQRLMDEGKLKRFNKNSPVYLTRYEF